MSDTPDDPRPDSSPAEPSPQQGASGSEPAPAHNPPPSIEIQCEPEEPDPQIDLTAPPADPQTYPPTAPAPYPYPYLPPAGWPMPPGYYWPDPYYPYHGGYAYPQQPVAYPPYGYSYPPGYPPWPGLPRVWSVFAVFFSALGGHLLLALLLGVYLTLTGRVVLEDTFRPEKMIRILTEPNTFIPFMGLSVMVSLLAAVIPALLSNTPVSRRLRLNAPRTALWKLLPMVIGALMCSWALAAAADILLRSLGVQPGETLNQLDMAISPLRSWYLLATIAIIGLIGPLAEELLFRGYMQSRLTLRWGATASVVLTSFLFGLLHMDPVQSTFAMGLGFFLGYITHRSGSVWPAVMGHALNNTLSVLITTVGRDWPIAAISPVVQLIACTLAMGACIVLIEWVGPRPGPEPVDDFSPPQR